MTEAGSVTGWIAGAKQGDQVAITKLCDRYLPQLVRIARQRLGTDSLRVADEEDVALSAFNTLCARVADGYLDNVNNRKSLWRILVTIVAQKAIDHRRHATRQKRGGGDVRGHSGFRGSETSPDEPGIAGIIADQPTPEMEAMITERFEELFGLLDDEIHRRIALERFEGHTNQEIADGLGRSVATVERCLKMIRRKWLKELSQ